MALVVVAIFDEVYDGEVAASLLRSADIPCWLLGDQLAKVYPFKQRAWGGCRLSVVADDAEDARDILDLARSGGLETYDVSDLPEASRGLGWTIAAVGIALSTSIESGWAVNGLRRKRRTIHLIGVTLLAVLGLCFVTDLVLNLWGLVRWLAGT